MTRDEFMKQARETARKILDGKENGIMNLVEQAWAEGKRNAEMPVYPSWSEWLLERGFVQARQGQFKHPNGCAYISEWVMTLTDKAYEPMLPADAEILGVKPKVKK